MLQTMKQNKQKHEITFHITTRHVFCQQSRIGKSSIHNGLLRASGFFSIIITMYIDSLVTNILKIKGNKTRQHRTQKLTEDIYRLL